MNLKGYRTWIINGLTFLAALFAWEDLQQFVDPQFIILGQAVINFVMRYFTTTPVMKH